MAAEPGITRLLLSLISGSGAVDGPVKCWYASSMALRGVYIIANGLHGARGNIVENRKLKWRKSRIANHGLGGIMVMALRLKVGRGVAGGES